MTLSASSSWIGTIIDGFRVEASVLLILLSFSACVGHHHSKSTESASDPHQSYSGVQKFREQITHRYTPDQYLIGIGQGDSERAAIELARGDLAKQVQARISTLASDVIRVEGGKTEQELGRIVTTQSDILLNGIITVERDRDSDSNLAYAAVVLPITDIDRLTESQQESVEESDSATSQGKGTKPIWVTAEGIVPFENDMTLAEAAARSRNIARRQAIEKSTGAFVKAQTVVHNTQVSEELVHSSSRGIVIEEQILEQGIRAASEATHPKTWVYATRLRAMVKPIPITESSEFKVDVFLNRTVFHEGEEIQVGIIPSHDSFVYILNVKQNDGVTILFPNKFSGDNFLAAQQQLTFPSEEQRERGIRLRVSLPPGQPKAIEKLKVLATSEKLDLAADTNPKRINANAQVKGPFMMTDVMKKLALLDGTSWTEMTIPYEIRP